MMQHLPTRWPRAFSAVGFGALYLFSSILIGHFAPMVGELQELGMEISSLEQEIVTLEQGFDSERLSAFRDRTLLAIERVDELYSLDPLGSLLEWMESLEPIVQGAIGFFLVFIAYVIGELLITVGTAYLLRSPERAKWSIRARRISEVGAVLLEERFRQSESAIAIIGGGLTIIVFSIPQIIIYDPFGNRLLASLIALTSIGLCFFLTNYISRKLGADLDVAIVLPSPASGEPTVEHGKT
ncbi:hypothetical protein JQC91_02250 [Jannaschia sp. Os4]|uniref:hypothetical protein n=1 Tax=Jannaschia sp. Os4 TaxID=2807617 RepID=UPI00193A8B52|nr:hypothetical protein [Jannaschia sp. Os4]MBM2575115.1 hypothetical protein [Jannaschia sp. Os4]